MAGKKLKNFRAKELKLLLVCYHNCMISRATFRTTCMVT